MAQREPPVQNTGLTNPVDDPAKLLQGALTPEELEVCQNIVVFGVEYLRSVKGWTSDATERFLKRSPVRTHIETLQKQYTDRTGIQERTQFFAQLKINAMVPAAINTMAKALRGTFTDPNTGNPVAPPTRGQFDAALQVLDRANIQGSKWGGNDSVPTIDARSIQIALGTASDPLKGLTGESRERLRGLLAAVTTRARAVATSDKEIKRRVAAILPERDDDKDPTNDG